MKMLGPFSTPAVSHFRCLPLPSGGQVSRSAISETSNPSTDATVPMMVRTWFTVPPLSLCSWGIGRSRWLKCMSPYTMKASPGGAHKQWGRPRKRGGLQQTPHPLAKQGHPHQTGGRGYQHGGRGYRQWGYPTTDGPQPVTKPQHARSNHHLHTTTETRIIRT